MSPVATKSLLRCPLSACFALCLLLLVSSSPLHATGWHTSGVQIDNPSGAPFTISGVNWYIRSSASTNRRRSR